MTQPLQNFPLRVGAPRYVLLAGGIGITAVAEMARVLRHVGADYTLVYVGRGRDRMAYVVELAELHGDRLAAAHRRRGLAAGRGRPACAPSTGRRSSTCAGRSG